MKRKLQFILLFIASTFISLAVCAQKNKSARPNIFAVVIGISQYQNPAIPQLTYADKDATLFADWLQSKAGGSVPGYQVKLFINEKATIANIYEALDWLKTKVSKDDIVYIYFSGHGDIETSDTISQGYLLAWNSPATNYRNNAISVANINENANDLTTRNHAKVIIITDACHSGSMAGDFYKGRQLTAANLQLVLNNQVRLASCEANQQAAEGPGWGAGRGVFSYYLLRGLQGLAAANNDGIIPLSSLETFLDTSFKKDNGLAIEKHQQNPVIDGSPLFSMAKVDTPSLNAIRASTNTNGLASAAPAGLQSLKTLGKQPIDYFFSIAKTAELDTVLHFENYTSNSATDVPFKIVNDYILYLQSLQKEYDSLDVEYYLIKAVRDSINEHTDRKDTTKWKQVLPIADSLWNLMNENSDYKGAVIKKMDNKDIATLVALQKQLENNSYTVSRFNEKLVQLTHEKSQDMINAYLNGDLAELERRQYYYAGSRQYRNFLSVLDVAIHVAPETNYLSSILKINRSYISGLVDRLEMTTSKKRDSLLQSAFTNQRQALKQEPYAAYIHNELGNLFLQQHIFDSAAYHFNYALMLSPAWAVPWSNKIRLNLALNKIEEAKEAIRIADSLQPNLAYVNVNAGLVMEKDSNYLAAESYYLNAIAQNKVHYLPFERLGFVYITTGRYALADSFLMEAKNRKDAFTVNEYSFDFGIELGGNPMVTDAEKYKVECTASFKNLPAWKPWILLEKALAKLIIHKPHDEDAEQKIKKVMAEIPGLPLAHHYLGRKYFLDSNWAMAEHYLTEAITRYLPGEQLKISLKSQFKELLRKNTKDFSSYNLDSNCLLTILMNYQYEQLEDHYMLGKVLEKLGKLNEAIMNYQMIAAIENQVQMDQAMYKGFRKISITNDQSMLDIEDQKRRYEKPVKMGGTLKAARLLEKQAKYEEAEALLLQQVQLNRKAGYARQEEMNHKNFGPSGRSPFNYFWLSINYDLEAETLNFYKRMLAIFPRDAVWYRRAGMFLYSRLQLTYSRIPIAEQKMFYEYSKNYAYPYRGSIDRPTEGVDNAGNYYKEINKFKLPGTGEEINIDMIAYDPLKTSQFLLMQAIKFSGETTPAPLLVEAMANLAKWMGNADAAIASYTTLLLLQPDSNQFRNALIEVLEQNKRLPAAANQLDNLNEKGALSREQTIKLACYKVLNKQGNEGLSLMDKYIPVTEEERNRKTSIYIQQLLLSGQLKKALRYCRDSLHTKTPLAEEFPADPLSKAMAFDNPGYTAARIHAMLKENIKAISTLKTLLDSGFNNIYVLKNDPAFASLRKTKKWKKMWAGYDFAPMEENLDKPLVTIFYFLLHYRIPGSNFNPDL